MIFFSSAEKCDVVSLGVPVNEILKFLHAQFWWSTVSHESKWKTSHDR